MAGVTMKSSHAGTKTYYFYDRTGACRPISTQAYYVKELNQDLLVGRGLTIADYQVVLNKRDSIAGRYPVGNDGTIDAANSFPFEGLVIVQTKILAKQFPIGLGELQSHEKMRNVLLA